MAEGISFWHVGELDVGRKEKREVGIVMRLDPDREEYLEGKEGGKVLIIARSQRLRRIDV